MRILIGSPIHQNPETLELFLLSLERLEKGDFTVHYLFVDDNDNPESQSLLAQFRKRNSEEVLEPLPGQPQTQMQQRSDHYTHYWPEEQVWRVAGYKNLMIEKALNLAYDALLLIDSDLVLHPKTLLHLVSVDQAIVAEIFWTRWQPNSSPLPQVWMCDEYSFFQKKPGLLLSDEQQREQETEFISRLLLPGLYEVGGLGACTLIRREVLAAGVNFSKVPNVSFWGEDRHFCIRAAVHGFSLFVDTQYPAFHMYREEDRKQAEAQFTNGALTKTSEMHEPVSSVSDDILYSRFFVKEDLNTTEFVYPLPAAWWSRGYEYVWCASFASTEHTVLDAACGISHPLKFYLAGRCAHVHACDLDSRVLSPESMIAEVRSDIGEEGATGPLSDAMTQIQFAHADLTALPYGEGMFDRVFCVSTLEHLSSDARLSALVEMHRVLKDEGLLVLTFDYPTVHLPEINEMIHRSGLEFVVPPDFTLPPDALYTQMWGGLYCFRAVLRKNKARVR